MKFYPKNEKFYGLETNWLFRHDPTRHCVWVSSSQGIVTCECWETGERECAGLCATHLISPLTGKIKTAGTWSYFCQGHLLILNLTVWKSVYCLHSNIHSVTTTKQKKLPKCILGHIESFKTHLFLGENRGGTYPNTWPFMPILAEISWNLWIFL